MPYHSYRELARYEQRGRDYRVVIRRGRTGLLIMAPHGGGIEPGTDALASVLAGRRHAFYGFVGRKPHGNGSLHLASHRFDEPAARRMACRALWILTLHGCAQTDASIRVGGRDRKGARIFRRCLQQAGFRARRGGRRALAGLHPANLCNRGRRGRGVQLEIARDLRNTRSKSAGPPPDRRLARALTAALAAIPVTVPAAATGVDRIQRLEDRRHRWSPTVRRPITISGRPSRLRSYSPSR